MHWFKNLVQLPLFFGLQSESESNIDRLDRYGIVRDTSNIRDLTWGNINFIHTTDTHGWYSGHFNQKSYDANWGDFISFTTNLRTKAHNQGQDLLVVDTGDRHDGNGLSDITVPNGNRSLPIFAKQDYDLLTIGNHELYEWENSKLEYEFIVQHYGENYVNTNVDILVDNEWVDFGNKYRYFTTPMNGYRILSFGFLFDFNRNNKNTKVTPIAEVITTEWFKNIVSKYPETEVDYLVIIGHIPVTREWQEMNILHQELRKWYPNIVIQYFGGHSHIRDFVIYDDKSTALESGRFCETVGWLSINDTRTTSTSDELESSTSRELDTRSTFSRSYIDFNLNSFRHHTNKYNDFNTKQGDQVKELIYQTRIELKLSEYIGYVKSNYYMDYVPIENKHSIFKLLSDKILPTLEYPQGSNSQRIIIINTGSVRYDLYKGNYTTDTQYTISPFRNDWSRIVLPKHIASRVSNHLNDGRYIKELLPPHQLAMKLNPERALSVGSPGRTQLRGYPKKLTKGYVTYDDFGNDGDDTIHYPIVNFPVPNVVESRQFNSEDQVDLIFYNFLTANIVKALLEITGDDYSENVEFYSKVYLSELLSSYIELNAI